MLLVCQLVQATLVGIVAERLFGALGVVIATIVNVVDRVRACRGGAEDLGHRSTPSGPRCSSRDRSSALGRASRRCGWCRAALIGLTNVILPGKGLKQGPFVSEEELLALADVAVEDDVIEDEERELIESIIEFGDTVVREVMVPRPDMVTRARATSGSPT